MKKFKIPVSWELHDYIEVEANSVEEAIEIFDQGDFVSHINTSLGYYVDCSFERDQDTEFIIELNQSDN